MSTTTRRLFATFKPPRPLVAATRSRTVAHERARLFSHGATRSKQEYLIQVPDFEHTVKQRLAAKKDHIIGATPLIESKQLSFFGVTLAESAPTDTANAAINGSVMVMEASSQDEIREFLEKDAYTKAGVWDVQNAKITPFRSG